MPRIPEIARPGLSLDVPGAQANLGGAGAVGEGLARLGGAVAGIGMDLAEKIKTEEARNAVRNAMLKDEIDTDKKFNELKVKYSTGYVTDENGNKKLNEKGAPISVSDEFKAWSNKQYHDTQLSMPSDLAQRMYQDEGAKAFTNSGLRVLGEERVWKVRSFNEDKEFRLRTKIDKLSVKPSLADTYRYADENADENNEQIGLIHGVTDAKDKTIKENEALALSAVKGAYNSILAGGKGDRAARVREWRSYLAGKDPVSKKRKAAGLPVFGEMLSATSRAQVEEDLIRLGKLANQMDHDQASAQISDTNHRLRMGVPDAQLGAVFSEAIPALNTLSTDADGNTKEIIKANLMAGLSASAHIGRMSQSPAYVFGSANDMTNFANSAQHGVESVPKELERRLGYKLPSVTSATVVSSLNDQIRQDIINRTNAKNHDIVSYVLSTRSQFPSSFNATAQVENALRAPDLGAAFAALPSGTISASISELESVSKQSGAPFRMSSKQTSEIFANNLKNSKDVPKTAYNVIALRNAYGDRFNTLMDSAIADGLPESWRIVGIFSDNPELTKVMVERIKTEGDVKDLFFKGGKTQDDLSVLDKELTTELTPIVGSFLRGNSKSAVGPAMINGALGAFRTHAMSLVIGGMSVKDAARAASTEFKNRWALIPGRSREQDLYIPVTHKTPAPYSHDASFSAQDYDNINFLSSRYSQKLTEADILTPSGASPKYYLEQARKHGSFVFTTNSAGVPGLSYKVQMPLYGIAGVRSQFLAGSDGSVMFIPLHDLANRASSFKTSYENATKAAYKKANTEKTDALFMDGK